MEIEIDPDRCMGHGQCELAAPGVFAVNDDALAELVDPDPAESRRPDVESAVDRCPEQAITLRG